MAGRTLPAKIGDARKRAEAWSSEAAHEARTRGRRSRKQASKAGAPARRPDHRKHSAGSGAVRKLLLLRLAAISAGRPGTRRGPAGEQAPEPDTARPLTKKCPNEIWWKWTNFGILAFGLGWLVRSTAVLISARAARRFRKGSRSAQVKVEAEARAATIEAKIANLSADVEALRKSSQRRDRRRGPEGEGGNRAAPGEDSGVRPKLRLHRRPRRPARI